MKTEDLLRAKIPCEETGIVIKRTMCDICTPGPQCGVDAYVKDGKIIKIEGTSGFPTNNGALCTKGASGRQYIYRPDRIKTPMKRVGARGENKFEPVSWEEALQIVADSMNDIKQKWGPESVAFMSGYPKWYRPWLHRLAYSFGSPNYLTESSSCHFSEVMSWKLTYGTEVRLDIMGNPDVLVGWGCNPLVSAYPMGRNYYKYKEQGGRVVIIDPRHTPTAVQCADLYIRPHLGTDGYLANTVARLIIENNWQDMDFIQKYVHGFEEYRDMVMKYTVEEAVRVTGVPEEEIRELARLIGTSKTALIQPSNGLTHHSNGLQTHRSVISLNALVGSVGRPGTLYPSYNTFIDMAAGFHTKEEEFFECREPKEARPKIGQERFPLWSEMMDEGQAMDFVRQCMEGKPYPMKAIYAHGVNDRMYLESDRLLQAVQNLDFVVATDLFWTDFCSHADIVLPACSSYERSEVKCYGGGFVNYTTPAIEPLYESRDDVAIITAVANALGLDDDLLKSGYDACVKDMFRDVPVNLDEVKASDMPVKIACEKPEEFFAGPFHTPSGKIELYSERIAKYEKEYGLKPLPEFYDALDDADPAEFPMNLMTGGRIPNAVHSRLHDVPWLRSLRPDPAADIHPDDAGRNGIKHGDDIFIITQAGKIKVKANVSAISAPGEVNMFHGYREANVNQIIPMDHQDPYTGFPSYKQVRCRIEKAEV